MSNKNARDHDFIVIEQHQGDPSTILMHSSHNISQKNAIYKRSSMTNIPAARFQHDVAFQVSVAFVSHSAIAAPTTQNRYDLNSTKVQDTGNFRFR